MNTWWQTKWRADPNEMCHRCTPRMTPQKTSSPGSRLRRDVAGRQPSEALDTCLKDSCSTRNQVWMVHKQNFFACLPRLPTYELLCFASNSGSFSCLIMLFISRRQHSPNLFMCERCFPSYFFPSDLDFVLFVFHWCTTHSWMLFSVFLFAENFCAFSGIYSFHIQALFVLIFMHVNISTALHFSRCFDS